MDHCTKCPEYTLQVEVCPSVIPLAVWFYCAALKNKLYTLLRVIPTLTDYFVIVSDISSGSIYGIISSDILFWHSIWNLFWHPIWHPFWHLTFSPGILSGILSAIFWGVCSGILFWHLFWHSVLAFYLAFLLASFWHLFWHSFWNSSSILSDILFWHSIWRILASILTFSPTCVEVPQCDLALTVEVRQCPLLSGARGWGGRGEGEEVEGEGEGGQDVPLIKSI